LADGHELMQSNQVKQVVSQTVARANSAGVAVSDAQADKICSFLEELATYNAHTNLVADASPERVAADHVLDSLSLVPHFPLNDPIEVIDIGTGAGFPGLILAIMLESAEFTLIDSIEKKCHFIETVVTTLHLENVEILAIRAEELAHERSRRERYDFATGRAVASTNLLLELSMPFLTTGGKLLLQKSQSQKDEALRTVDSLKPVLGCAVTSTHDLDPSVFEKPHSVIVVEKNKRTVLIYPRPWSKMKANPLS
jgi:16S rRNA (guanine527-N7)-methyltransferase